MAAFDEEVKPRREDFLDPSMATESARLQGKNRTAGLGLLFAMLGVTAIGILLFREVFAGLLVAVFVCLAGALFYLIPSIVAASRDHHNARAIFAFNLLLGWTFIGWAVALVWALLKQKETLQR